MLKDKDTTVGQQTAVKDESGYLLQTLQRVWWVGEDDVELLMTGLDKLEHVATDDNRIVGTQGGYALPNEGIVVAVGFHAHHLPATA